MADVSETPEVVTDPPKPVQVVGPIRLLYSSMLSEEENAKLGSKRKSGHGMLGGQEPTVPIPIKR